MESELHHEHFPPTSFRSRSSWQNRPIWCVNGSCWGLKWSTSDYRLFSRFQPMSRHPSKQSWTQTEVRPQMTRRAPEIQDLQQIGCMEPPRGTVSRNLCSNYPRPDPVIVQPSAQFFWFVTQSFLPKERLRDEPWSFESRSTSQPLYFIESRKARAAAAKF